MVTLNKESTNGEGLTQIILDAFRFFPDDTWEGVNYLGNVDIDHHVKIMVKNEQRRAFFVRELIERIRKLRKLLEVHSLLLALTLEPVIVSYYNFEKGGFRRIINLVRDYVTSDIGMISLYDTNDDNAIRISAHGLGHNRGLSHHSEPVDLMYVGLTNGSHIETDGFCNECHDKLDLLRSKSTELSKK